ncbi:MAG: hypothetical protein E2P02_10320 [Acidobacteria bacterium]|nr:MAG: hypothetical protein E2P02_10320 [Acidobacteriota bacterium]
MLWKIVESALDETKQLLLIDLIQTYFTLTDEQMERYQRLASRKENRKVQDVDLTWSEKLEQKGLEKGFEKGREEGLVTGKREAVLRLLTAKFGALPQSTRKHIGRIDSADELDGYLDRVLVASSLDDMKLDT